jgi:type IV pilus assembly protein PilN
MIKINLLPVKQDRRREAGRNQLLVAALAIVVEIIVGTLLYLGASTSLTEQKNANGSIQTQVDRIEKQVGDHQKILADIQEYEKRQEAIDNLEAARTGPAFLMLELSTILSKNGRPNIDHNKYQQMIQTNPTLAFDESWDFRRLWLDSFAEKDKVVKIAGQGLTHEDVAEFLRRLQLSSFFVSSELISTNLAKPKIAMKTFPADETDPVVHFMLQATIRYK